MHFDMNDDSSWNKTWSRLLGSKDYRGGRLDQVVQYSSDASAQGLGSAIDSFSLRLAEIVCLQVDFLLGAYFHNFFSPGAGRAQHD